MEYFCSRFKDGSLRESPILGGVMILRNQIWSPQYVQVFHKNVWYSGWASGDQLEHFGFTNWCFLTFFPTQSVLGITDRRLMKTANLAMFLIGTDIKVIRENWSNWKLLRQNKVNTIFVPQNQHVQPDVYIFCKDSDVFDIQQSKAELLKIIEALL